MAYEFKKLGEVEALTEMPENANAIMEVNGTIKRIPGNAFGAGGNSGNTYRIAVEIAPADIGYTASSNVTYADIKAAYDSGILPYVVLNDGSHAYLNKVDETDQWYSFISFADYAIQFFANGNVSVTLN